MLETMSQAIEPLGNTLAAVGALGSFLSFLLAIYLEWGTIKARVKGRSSAQAELYAQSIAETKPGMPVPVGGYTSSNTPGLDISSLVGKLFLDLMKTMFAIFTAIVISAEYLLLANRNLGTGLPYEWLLIASLALGSILGAYLRVRSWFLLLLIGVASQVGILALAGWSLQDVPAILESVLRSGLTAGL